MFKMHKKYNETKTLTIKHIRKREFIFSFFLFFKENVYFQFRMLNVYAQQRNIRKRKREYKWFICSNA